MTSKQKKAVHEYAETVKRLAEHINIVRIKLEAIASDVFLDLSCEGKADSEEVRLFDEGNNRLARAEDNIYDALSFYAELTGDKTLENVKEAGAVGEDRSATSRRSSPTVGEEKAPIAGRSSSTNPRTAGKLERARALAALPNAGR